MPAGWRNVGPQDQPRRYVLDGTTHEVRLTFARGRLAASLDGADVELGATAVRDGEVVAELGGRRHAASVLADGAVRYVDGSLGAVTLQVEPRLRPPEADEQPGSLHAPLPGAVRRVAVSVGATVEAGELLVVLEAMKMQHSIRSPHDGEVTEVMVAEGDQVESGDTLVVVVAAAEAEKDRA